MLQPGGRVIKQSLAGVTPLLVLVCASSAQAAISFQSSTTAATSTLGATSLSIGKPTIVSAGYIEIATIGLTGASTVTPPTGWTQIIDTSVGTALQQASFWHIAGASEGTSTWTFSATSVAAGGIAVYSGVDTSTIVDSAASATGTSGKTATIPSVNASYAGDLVLGAGAFNNAGTLTGSATLRYSKSTTAGPVMGAQDTTQAGSGATTSQTVTDSLSATAWIGQAIALKAASAAGILSVQTTAAPSFSAVLDGGDQSRTYTLPLTTTASVSPSVGWNMTVTSTQFTTGAQTLPGGASSIASAPTVSCYAPYASCTGPTNSVAYPVTIPAGPSAPTPVRFLIAAPGSGVGAFTITPTVQVQVPQNSFAGSYTSTLTIAIASGP